MAARFGVGWLQDDRDWLPPGPARSSWPACRRSSRRVALRISVVAEGMAQDLAALGALGDEAMANAARLLAVAMQGPITARLLEVLGNLRLSWANLYLSRPSRSASSGTTPSSYWARLARVSPNGRGKPTLASRCACLRR